MKAPKVALAILTSIALTSLMTPAFASPGDDQKTEEKDGQKHQSISGKVEKVDTSANTVLVDGKTYNVVDGSKLTKQGKTISLSDLAVGDEVRGKAHEVNGRNEVVSLTIGGKKSKES